MVVNSGSRALESEETVGGQEDHIVSCVEGTEHLPVKDRSTMFRYVQDVYNGKLLMNYRCKFPQCWRRYYHRVGSDTTFTNEHFFKFPRDPELRQQWKEICNLTTEHCDAFRVCENHFLQKDFTNITRCRLNPGVVPKHLELVVPPLSSFEQVSKKNGDEGLPSCSTMSPVPSTSSGKINLELANVPHIMSIEQVSDDDDDDDEEGLTSCTSMCLVPSTSIIRRGILGIGVSKSCLSPRKQRMYCIHRNAISRVARLKKSLQDEREKVRLLKKCYDAELFADIEDRLNSVTVSFINSQLRNAKRTVQGRRWTTDDKIFALSLYKRSPRLYRYLGVHFSLPSTKILKDMLSKLPFEPGLNPAVLNVLQSHAMRMREPDKYCCLMLDEISLDKGLHYEANKQIICGYEDLGHLGRSSKKANHALVFMLRGLRKGWKQVIAYYFTSNAISSSHLKVLLCHVIREVQKIGLNIVCTVCDQGSANQGALKALCKENRDGSDFYFIVNGEKIAIVYDVPHLLKSTRNALIGHKIEFEPHKEAKFEYIEQIFQYDQQNPFKALHKLRKQYFNFKDSYIKMKVKVAAAQLSLTVAGVIYTYVSSGWLPQEAAHTAEFVGKIDTLFDSLNSSGPFQHDYKKFKCSLSNDSPHIPMWYDMLKEMKNWKIIELATGRDRTNSFSFLKGWQTTMKSIMFVWKKVQSKHFLYLSTRAFNQDPLENLFCCIRQHGMGNTNPTCFQFKAALKTVILNKMVLGDSKKSNCEDDGCSPLNNLRQLLSHGQTVDGNSESAESHSETVGTHIHSIPECNLSSDKQALAYVAGYVLKRVGVDGTIDCEQCKISLFSPHILQSHLYTMFKEGDPEAPRLTYASESVMLLLQNIHDQLYAFLNNCGHTSALEDHFISIFKMPDDVMVCEKHAIHTIIIKRCVPFLIYKYIRDTKDDDSQKRKFSGGHDKKVKKFKNM